MKLSMLCQSPVIEGRTPSQAVAETLELARCAESNGYHRFWVAEHHSDKALASASPEIMIARIASMTERIRVGSGGVLLPHHRPLAVAERFNLLQALFPGRIDLGVGRSGGSEGRAPQALGSRFAQTAPFADADELLSWLGQGTNHRPFPEVFASPAVDDAVPVWVLGSSPASARYAADRGLPYAFGAFLNPQHMVAALTTYHQHFTPSQHLDRPKVMLGWFTIVADTEAEAQRMAACSELWFVESFMHGKNPLFPTTERAVAAKYSMQEQMMVNMKRQACSVGTPDQVAGALKAMSQQFAIDEWMIVTITEHQADRIRSYELLADALDLTA
jgi:luciferase family oxidoreductase group 1